MTDDQRERRATTLGDEGGPHHVNDAQRWKHAMAADDALPRTVASAVSPLASSTEGLGSICHCTLLCSSIQARMLTPNQVIVGLLQLSLHHLLQGLGAPPPQSRCIVLPSTPVPVTSSWALASPWPLAQVCHHLPRQSIEPCHPLLNCHAALSCELSSRIMCAVCRSYCLRK
jgi:hypothetical protein